VIEEYIRPARLIEHGELVVKPALSDPELLDFPGVGTLEAFNTDGLRSLITTIKAPFMKEKTLRYPGHVQLVRALRDSGFFDKSHIEVNGVRVRPIDVTSKLLFSLWQTEEDEEEFIIMKVQVEGRKGGKHMKYTYELYDEYDEESGMPSMARTTGFTCAVVTRLLAEGRIAQPGVLPPELLTRDSKLLDHVTGELEKRGVMLDSEISELG
jgi:saccharopine dehydrogenase-like NADP-dependent oxidoreductase